LSCPPIYHTISHLVHVFFSLLFFLFFLFILLLLQRVQLLVTPADDLPKTKREQQDLLAMGEGGGRERVLSLSLQRRTAGQGC